MTTVIWEGNHYDTIILSKVTKNRISYWHVQIDEEIFWVIPRYITCLRPLITYWAKIFFDLRTLPVIRTLKRGKCYLLYRVNNINDQRLLPNLIKEGNLTDEVIIQAQKIYAFRRMMLIHSDKNDVIIYRTEGYSRILYSIYENGRESNFVSQAITNRWFQKQPITSFIRSMVLSLTPKPCMAEVSKLSFGIETLDEHLNDLIKIIDVGLVGYGSEVICEIILMLT